MCKHKNLSKPNHWRIVLFIDHKKHLIELKMKLQYKVEEKALEEHIQVKDRYTVADLSKELNMSKSHLREYLHELNAMGEIDLCVFKGKMEVIL